MTIQPPNNDLNRAVDVTVKLGLLFLVFAWCLKILAPFIPIVAWGGIIAIALHKPYQGLSRRLGGRGKLTLALFVVAALALVIVPTWLFAGSLIASVQEFHAGAQAGEFQLRPPPDSVRGWPLVGERLYAAWSEASSNLGAFLSEHSEQVQEVARTALGKVAGLGLTVIGFIIATLIAAVLLAHADAVHAALLQLARRLAGDLGDEYLELSVATIRSVVVGVLGIAFIQALLGGIGMVAVGIPAVGVWTLLILVLAIAQLPPLLVLLPMIVYVFSQESTAVAIVFAIWSIAVSFSDAVLKPLLLGRGVKVPMLVILLGAIGGMITSGIIGLFVGAVVLALGYQLFEAWVKQDVVDDDTENAGTVDRPPGN